MSKRVLGVALATVLCLSGGVSSASAQTKKKTRATVKIVNRTDWDIHHLYLASHDSDDWGEDQLGEHTIPKKGGAFSITDIPCETYDVQLVDEEGDKCEVESIDICGGNETWAINNKDLLACQGWGEN
jgi:hypothetical protein